MSIIEKATKLADSVEETEEETSGMGSAVAGSGTPAPDMIERVVGEQMAPRIVPEPEELAVWRRHPTRPKAPEVDVVPNVDVGGKLDAGVVTPQGPAKTGLEAHEETGSGRTINIDRAHLHARGTVQPDGARTPVAECFRLIKSQLLAGTSQAGALEPGKAVMVTSALPGEGKTFCAVNLAISLALEKDRSVLLVDGDVSNPSVPDLLGIDPDAGLMDALMDRNVNVDQLVHKTDIGGLSLLHAGGVSQHATELLGSDAMRLLVRRLCAQRDDRIVIFDSPPLLLASESSVLANHMQQIIMVVEAGATQEQAVKDALERIEASKVAGIVLNKGRSARRGYGYGAYA